MRFDTFSALTAINRRWPVEYGKIVQMLLAISFDPRRGGFTVLNHYSEGVDLELTRQSDNPVRVAYERRNRDLDPQLVWRGKDEQDCSDLVVHAPPLYIQEKVQPKVLIDELLRETREREHEAGQTTPDLFADFNGIPMGVDKTEFYQHDQNWSNRMILGDSLQVMASLAEREGLRGKLQCIYFDPPYGIRFDSNFQWSTTTKEVRDKIDNITREPEQVKAFRDTWRDGIHSYLTYLRDRLTVARDLLADSGSIFVQIGDENVHLLRGLMDEVFSGDNFCSLLTFRKKTMPLGSEFFEGVSDYILWYAKNKASVKTRPLMRGKSVEGDNLWTWAQALDGSHRKISATERDNHKSLPKDDRVYRLVSLLPAQYRPNQDFVFNFNGQKFDPPKKSCWKTTLTGMERMAAARRIQQTGHSIQQVLFHDDYPVTRLTSLWADTGGASEKIYVVQTSETAILRCILSCTDPGDLVLDPTCGSGTTAYVAEQWGRRWITFDTSRIAITLAKQRLMTALFDYYELAHPDEGVGSGFRYKTVPHITLKSIANNPEIKEGMSRKEIEAAIKKYADQETLYDRPYMDNSKARVTGPFTVEAVPAPSVKPLMEMESDQPADASISRSGETLRQAEWRDEILKTGIRARSGAKILFSRVEPLQGTHWLHAEAETKEDNPQKAVISFGPEHAPLEQRQVALAIEESLNLVPKPKVIIFAAFEFDPEAAKDIDETNWPGITLIKVKMSEDLLTEDLKKKRASNDSFWLIGQPDIMLEKIKEGENKGKYRVEVLGFDYYNPRTGTVDSGGAERIAMWMLDTDYDGRSLFPRQIFFPMSGPKDGWTRLAKNLKAEIDEELIEAYHGRVSLPFEPGTHERIAVKIVDDRGIESLKLMDVRS